MTNPAPNSRDVAATTPGIARNMQPQTEISAPGTGGGDLNGTAATLLHGQAGTTGQRVAVPRAMAGNSTGIV